MDSAVHDALIDGRHRRSARWLVVVGFGVWSAGLALWEQTWIGSLAASVAGGAALTYRIEPAGPRIGRRPLTQMGGLVPVTISLVLISQGVGQSDFGARVALVGLGTLGMILVFLRISTSGSPIERRLAERNLADERRRLAGEVHDVVGHTLSASMLHTTAARLSDPVRPRRGDRLPRTRRGARAPIDGRHPQRRPPPARRRRRRPVAGTTVRRLPELVEELPRRRRRDHLLGERRLDDLPATTALTVYRVVQEGLTNAVRHGTGTIDLTVASAGAGDHVEIEIANDRRARPAASPGSGLAGMRERVNAVGGTLDVGRHRRRPPLGAARQDPDMIRVLLVDDQEVIREGMRSLIATDPQLTVVGECADGDEVVDHIARCTPTSS
jgi:signal transduction histidine kinase